MRVCSPTPMPMHSCSTHSPIRRLPKSGENFNDFVKTIRAKHPVTPIIFQQTIYRGSRNFNTDNDQKEAAKMAAAEEMVRKAMETDPNIYIVYPAADTDGSTCTDKTHPSDMGYYNWMESIRQPILDILAKYNMK